MVEWVPHETVHQPCVSVLMLVYNHERWLAHAIESVMMQDVTFDYELIIGEDCSTDRSREIALDYKKKYPDRIRLLLNQENLGMAANGRQVVEAATGKYIACLEGDDYWTDSHKLQIQVDFLETHPEYSGCYHSVDIVNENDEPLDVGWTPYVYSIDRDYTKEDWRICILPGQSGSIVMRNYYKSASREVLDICYGAQCNGDNVTPILLLHHGKIRQMGKAMSCYRRTYTGDSWNARVFGKDMRAFYYKSAMERDRLAMKLWRMSFLPHSDARGQLYSLLEDAVINHEKVGQLLQEVVLYDVWQFIAFLFVLDFQRISNCKSPILLDISSVQTNLKKNKFVVFGIGVNGEKTYQMLTMIGLRTQIQAFFDNDIRMQKKPFHGIPIKKPNEKFKGYKLIISSIHYADEMHDQLIHMGYNSEDLFTIKDVFKWVSEAYCFAIMQRYPNIYKYYFG